MIVTNNLTLKFGTRILFENVSIKFSPGNCYGLIGANGAGKSTFLKILSGEIESTSGNVSIAPGERLAVLNQNHFEFDEYEVVKTVIMGHKRLYEISLEKEMLYSKPDFSESDGIKAADLEAEFEHLNGWQAESDAANLLSGLGIDTELHNKLMKELSGKDKVKVLLAQALFGNPDNLLLDEPTNHLDINAINWLENFLADYDKTIIVVSHDRHFLNKVCTHMADIDFGKIQLYMGNYDFWQESSQLALQMMRDQNKKKEEKIKDLQAFIARFSANASKSKQATSRKKILEKITLEDIRPSNRKYPYVDFKPDREIGNDILDIKHIKKEVDGEKALKNFSLLVNRGDKIAFVGPYELAKTTLFRIITGEDTADEGEFVFGKTISHAYFPKDNTKYFDVDLNLVDWLRQYSKEQSEDFIRGFLGRMLFSGDEALKKANVLSGGEKVRCMLSRMMLSGANLLILDEPTNHLDLEAITSLNNGLINFKGVLLFSSHDHQFVQTIANRIVEITPNGFIDRKTTFDEYLEDENVKKLRENLYKN